MLYEAYRKPYRLRSFFFDCLMVFVTSGVWLIWIFIREMRQHRAPGRVYQERIYHERDYR